MEVTRYSDPCSSFSRGYRNSSLFRRLQVSLTRYTAEKGITRAKTNLKADRNCNKTAFVLKRSRDNVQSKVRRQRLADVLLHRLELEAKLLLSDNWLASARVPARPRTGVRRASCPARATCPRRASRDRRKLGTCRRR